MSFGSNVKRERVPTRNRRQTQDTPTSITTSTKRPLGRGGIDRKQREYASQTYLSHWVVIESWDDPDEVFPQSIEPRLLELDIENRSIIHHAIPHLKAREAPGIALEYIEEIVLKKPSLFIDKDKSGKLPMIEAAQYQPAILFRVIDLLVPTQIFSSSAQKCHGEQQYCPLHKVAQGRLKQSRKGKPSGSGSKPMADEPFTVENKGCLHGLIDIKILREKDGELREALQSSLKENPEILHHLFKVDKFDQDSPGLIPLASFNVLVKLLSDENFMPQHPEGLTPLQKAVGLFGEMSIDYELLFEVIQTSVNKCPQSIFIKGGKGCSLTVYQILEDKRSEQNAEWVAKTEDLLKKTCVGAKKIYDQDKKDWISQNIREKKNEFLYSHAPLEKRFFLNLTGERSILDQTYIETIFDSSGMQFESVLESVKLPYWKPHSRKEKQSTSLGDGSQNPHTGKAPLMNLPDGESGSREIGPYRHIFRLLWENGVHKIFTIEIDDDGEEPHTNAAIREALRGTSGNDTCERDFGIEVWKWMKFDICSETIFKAAPKVKELHLFSSANIAVLRGWASESGLPKLQDLERLIVEIFPTNEDDEKDCRHYEEEFAESLHKCNSQLSIDVTIHNCTFQSYQDMSRIGASSNPASKGSQDSRQSKEWIKNLSGFNSFVVGLQTNNHEGSVKIALLDDGSKLENLHGTQTGKSFREDGRDYFVGDCEHGTQMAHCIRKICPMAELYIARLDDSGASENQTFSKLSCLQALRWALKNKVDIVSMSWSFARKGSENDEYEKEFCNLINRTENVIFFASLRDDGPEYQNKEFAPVGLENVIRIASATTFGTASQENTHNAIDFLLPGENLQNQAKTIVSGSSYATAYAAGLAGIVLCCIKLYQHLDDNGQDVDLIELAKSRKGMSNIFCHLGGREPEGKDEKGIFLMPSRTFARNFEDHRMGEVTILGKLVNSMIPEKDRPSASRS